MSVQTSESSISFANFLISDEAGNQMFREYEKANGSAENSQRVALIDAKKARSQLIDTICFIVLDTLLLSFVITIPLAKTIVIGVIAYEAYNLFEAIGKLFDSYVKLQPTYIEASPIGA